MVVQLNAIQEIMSTGSMDITETFRTDDITKTDFFDFVTAPDTIGIGLNDRVTSDTNGNNLDAPLQGFDQVKPTSSSEISFAFHTFQYICVVCLSSTFKVVI